MSRSPTSEELLERAIEHGAVLGYALRHVTSAWHRKHAGPSGPSWANCQDHFCAMAHDAVEGRARPGKQTEYGTVTCLVKNEPSVVK